MKRISFLPLVVWATLAFRAIGAEPPPTPDKIFISPEAAKALLDSDKAIDPKKGDGFRRLQRAFPNRDKYSVAEVLAIRDGKPKDFPGLPTVLPNQTGRPPRDAWTLEQVKGRFATQEKINPKTKGAMERLQKRVPNAEWYTTEQMLNAENVEKIEDVKPEDQARYNALARALQAARQGEARAHQGVGWPRIRRDWRDVIYDEDQSQGSKVKALSDLEGALFSYTRNGRANTDTWNAHAALILPITYQPLDNQNGPLWRVAAAPSVTYDRVTTNGNPKDEVDSLFYRAGLFFDIYDQADTNPIFGYGFQARAAGVRVTNQNQHASLNGFEADLEPRFHVGNHGLLGYQTSLWPKTAPVRADGNDISLLDAQLRTWLHMEAGDVQDTGAVWSPVTGSFFRLGPTVQFQLSMPSLPGDRALSLTALYSYLATVSGSDDRSNYFRATLAYDLFRDLELNHKVSISASYEKGGLNFTKQKVDTFTIGLGVLF
jgi:hypothetical protein